MKALRLVAIVLFVGLSPGLLPAPLRAAVQPKSAAAPTVRSPEDMAKDALARWKLTLKITDAQAPRFESVMTDSYRKMAQARAAAAGDRHKLQTAVTTILKDRDESLAKVLTPGQMKLYRENLHHAASYAKAHVDKATAAK
jgi:hypothetical protein